MRTIVKTEEPSHDPTGWFNFCPACGCRYWVRASDLGHHKARRFTGPESDERHECKEA